MKKTITSMLLVLSMLFASTSSASVMFWLDPSFQISSTGSSVTLDLKASGFGDMAADSLGAWDLDITFDDSVLSYTGHSLAGALDMGLFGSLDLSLGLWAPGTLGLAELSLEDAADLDSMQPGEMTLATIMFDVDLLEIPDFTIVDIVPVAFSDASATAITDFTTAHAVIATTDVPEPSAILLFAAGLGLVMLRRRKS